MKLGYCIIDTDLREASNLSRILEISSPGARFVYTFAGLGMAFGLLTTEAIDLLFIRIELWDDYRKAALLLPRLPATIVFLSGRSEKCTRHLAFELDCWLQPPYLGGRVRKVLDRATDKSFERRTTELFFVRENRRYHPVAVADLRAIRRLGSFLVVETRERSYEIRSSLSAFQRRAAFPLERVARDVLVTSHVRG